jgi:hypothetical protein
MPAPNPPIVKPVSKSKKHKVKSKKVKVTKGPKITKKPEKKKKLKAPTVKTKLR